MTWRKMSVFLKSEVSLIAVVTVAETYKPQVTAPVGRYLLSQILKAVKDRQFQQITSKILLNGCVLVK